ncbi:MAG: hypothetical protein ACI8UO_002237 [Verrucomicrobiales bacterium]
MSSAAGNKWNIERAMREKPPALHPLAGCDTQTMRAHLEANSSLSPRTRMQRFRAKMVVKLRQPFAAIERLRFAKKVEAYEMPSAPIFIVGHWRSGTTHLHNLLSHDPQFSFLDFGQTAMPHNMLNKSRHIGRWFISRSLPKERGFDKVELTVDSPQEEEMALGALNPLTYYNVYYFPQNWRRHFDRAIFFDETNEADKDGFKAAYLTLMKKLAMTNGGRQLLMKNPPSTARLTLLKELFPRAKFIYIHRNPYEVFPSSIKRYPRTYSAFAWQDFENVDLEEMVFYKYDKLLKTYLDQRSQIPAEDLVETSYDAVTTKPEDEIERIYDALGIPAKTEALEAIRPYLEKKKNYKRNVHQLTRAQVDRIQSDWAFSLERWPYEIPEGIEVVDP